MGIDSINLTIFADKEKIDVVELGNIDIGYGRTLKVENMKLGGVSESVEFVLDAEGRIRELNKENNVVEMTLGD